jgi:hypothetical protein
MLDLPMVQLEALADDLLTYRSLDKLDIWLGAFSEGISEHLDIPQIDPYPRVYCRWHQRWRE